MIIFVVGLFAGTNEAINALPSFDLQMDIYVGFIILLFAVGIVGGILLGIQQGKVVKLRANAQFT